MKATVQQLRPGYAGATTDTDILVVFRPPVSPALHLGDALDVDLFCLDREQTIQNLSQQFSFPAVIHSNDIHDLRLSGGHGTSRLPTMERRSEQPPEARAA